MLGEDSDDDIFVIHQSKPVLRLTNRQGLLIKNQVLRQAKLDFQGNVVSQQETQKTTIKKDLVTPQKKRKTSFESPNRNLKKLTTEKPQEPESQNVNSPKTASKKSPKISPVKTPSKSITDYYSPTKKKENNPKISVRNDLTHRDIVVNADVLLKKKDIEKYDNDPAIIIDIDSSSSEEEVKQTTLPAKREKVSPAKKTKVLPESSTAEKDESITLSPGIKRNKKRFKSLKNIVGPTKKSKVAAKKNLFSVPVPNIDCINKSVVAFKPSISLVLEKIQDFPDSETLSNESDRLDADILKFIIQNVMELQIYLKKMTVEANKVYEGLLNESEMNILEKYTYLNRDCQTLFMRMFFRKQGWHRVSAIVNQYLELKPNIEGSLKVLETVKYINRNIHDDDILVQLGLLKSNELSTLSKTFSVGNTGLRKEALVNAILADTKAQRSVLDLFKPTSKSRRLEMIAEETQKLLGPCFQIDVECRKTIHRIVLLFSIFHEVESESKRAHDHRYLLYEVLVGTRKFVSFDVIPTVIFFNRNDFLEYENALNAKEEMEVALKAKDHTEFSNKARQSNFVFQILVKNKGYCDRVLSLPTFLRRYNAGSVHARLLTTYCEHFKKKTSVLEVVEILKLLLGQAVFCQGYRGKWIELLCQSYQSLKMMEEAAVLLITALEDDQIDEVKKYSLVVRGQAIAKAKKNRITNESMRLKLESLCVHNIEEPSSIEILAQALSGNPMGSKLVYVQNTAKGKSFSSVEEEAITYYKKHGYTQGIHAEGFIVSTIFYFLFFDVIYSAIPGVFQSQFQEGPLDMWSSSFYTNRKEAIDARIDEIGFWSPKTFSDCIENIFAKYKDTSSVIAWKTSITPQLLCEIIECVGIAAVIAICKRFAYTPRLARSGFPDLTLWNSVTKKAKFAEVKSPNDRLAPNQRLWLQYLRNAGIDCEVCNVRNIGSKFQ